MALTATKIINELKKCGFDYVVTVPDDGSRRLYQLLESQPDLKLVPVCRESETIAIAAGLMLGGKSPVVMIQNTGFYEVGDSLRGQAIDLKLPMLLLINCRGWQKDAPMTDSASIYIRPAVEAWGIKHYLVESNEDVPKISRAHNEAKEAQKPAVVLFGCEINDDEQP